MMRHLLIGIACFLFLAGCNQETSSPIPNENTPANKAVENATSGKAQKGTFLVRITGMETESQSQGLIQRCNLNIELDNQARPKVRRISIGVIPETTDEFDARVFEAAGPQSFYFRKLPKGKSTDVETFTGLGCEGLKSITIGEITCLTEEGTCSPDIVKFDDGGFIEIIRP